MDWKYKLKRSFGNRYAMTAVLFLLILAWGSLTALGGVLTERTGCSGYAVPADKALMAKGEPGLPRRSPGSLPGSRLDLPAAVESWPGQLSAKAARAEGAVTRALEEDHSLIELYGAFQSFAGRTVVEDTADPQYAVAQLADGSLTFVGRGVPDPQVQAGELERLRDALYDRDISLLYVQAPSKLAPGGGGLPYAVTDTSNACADRLLAELDERGVDRLDLREVLARAGGVWSDWFYKTDHHWTQEAAFLCFQALAQELTGYRQTTAVGLGTKTQRIAIDPRCTDPACYQKDVLSAFFLGSQGKRVGSAYAGADDFVLWTPTFPTLLRYATGSEPDRYGALEETVLFQQRVEERDYYDNTPYTYYAGGDYPFAQVTNYYNPQGPRVMLIRDSYACALTPYLALASSQLTTVDPRSFSGDLLATVDYVRPDVVVVLYSSGMVREEAPYRLLDQGAGPSKADSARWLDGQGEGAQK